MDESAVMPRLRVFSIVSSAVLICFRAAFTSQVLCPPTTRVMASASDFYADLGVTPDASTAEITKAFRKLALAYHPDRGGDPEKFQQINKAYEVLSNDKSRSRYDNTGNSGPMSVEEEFRSFFASNTADPSERATSKRQTQSRSGPTDAEREEAQRKEAERLESVRRAEETERRDAERRARASGVAPPPRTPAAAPKPASPSNATSSPGQGLSEGDRIRIVGIKARQELNGQTGTLVAKRDDRWQVMMDVEQEDKLLKAQNLELVFSASTPPVSSPAPTLAPSSFSKPQAKSNVGPASSARQQAERAGYLQTSTQAAEQPKAKANASRTSVKAAGTAKKDPDAALPRQQYKVTTDFAVVRSDPHLEAGMLGTKKSNERVYAVEETFDGWVRLANEPGWMIKDMQGKKGIDRVLWPVGALPVLAVPEPFDISGPQKFQVVFRPHVAIRAEPSQSARLLGVRKHGETLLAAAQTYGGWIRLHPDEGEGWMLIAHAHHGELLRCMQMDAQQRHLQEMDEACSMLQQALIGKDMTALRNAILRARAAGVAEEDLRAAEVALADLERTEAVRNQLKIRIDKARGDERELRQCIDEATRNGLREEAQNARKLLAEAVEAKSKTQQVHAELLERLENAAASRDPAEVKVAKDAAKRGGVDAREIARAFALGSARAEEAAGNDKPPPQSSPVSRKSEPQEVTVQIHQLDGKWANESGEYMASILGPTIMWADGPGADLTRTPDGYVSCELFGEVFRARPDDDGRLVWSDGDIWVRMDDSTDV